MLNALFNSITDKEKITNIAKGHLNEAFGLNVNLSEARMKICEVCPIYSPKFGGLCNNKLYLDPETNDVSFTSKDGYVRGCGCRLKAKTTIPEESCVADKW